MNLIRLLIVFPLIFLQTCSNSSSSIDSIKINSSVLKRYAGDKDDYIIMSCIRCSCFDESLRNLKLDDIKYLQQIPFIIDTSCGKIKLQNIHVNQNIIDSISDEISNITLIKNIKNDNYVVRVIKQDESDELLKICRRFFRN